MKKTAGFLIFFFLFSFFIFSMAAKDTQTSLYIIELKESAPTRMLMGATEPSAQERWIDSTKAQLKREIDVPYTYRHVLNGVAMALTEEEAASLSALPSVKKVWKEQKYHLFERGVSTEQLMCGVDAAWEDGYLGEGIVVAVIDSECDTDHAMFTLSEQTPQKLSYEDIEQVLSAPSSLNAQRAYSSVLRAEDVYKSSKIPFAFNYGLRSTDGRNAKSNHGTHVTGIVGANNLQNAALGMNGVAPNAQILSLSCMTQGGELQDAVLLAALDDAVALGADIVNCSWGADGGSSEDSVFSEAIQHLSEQGIIVVCAAGNIGKVGTVKENESTQIPAEYTDYGPIATPAASAYAVAVAACNTGYTAQDAQVTDFSSWGTSSSLCLKPEITAPGYRIYSTYENNRYGMMSGTSMAAPFYTGAAAVTLQYVQDRWQGLNKASQAQKTKQLLMTTAKTLTEAENSLPISPRAQGAGVVCVRDAIQSELLLYNEGQETKIELKDSIDEHFTLRFYAENLEDREVAATLSGCVLSDDATYDSQKKGFFVTRTQGLYGAVLQYGENDINAYANTYTPAQITFAPHEKKWLEIECTLDASVTAQKSAIFKNGFFVEGYIWLTTQEREYSIPYLGYVGDWTKAKLFDRLKYEQGKGFYGDSYLLYPYEDLYYIMGEGMYEVTVTGNAAYNAISPNGDTKGDYVGAKLLLLRSAKNLTCDVTNDGGASIFHAEVGSVEKTVRYDEPYMAVIWDGKDEEEKVVPDGDYTITLTGTMDYKNKEDALTIPIAVDTQAPILTRATAQTTDEGLVLSLAVYDNHYFQLAKISEENYVQTQNPIKDAENTVLLSDLPAEDFQVTLIDYAFNETTCSFSWAKGIHAFYRGGRLIAAQQYRALLQGKEAVEQEAVPPEGTDQTKTMIWSDWLMPEP